MTPKQLFQQRLKREWNYHYEVWKSAVDWIIALYFIVPFVIFICYQYYSIWTDQAPWIEAFPLQYTRYIFFYICLIGSVRLFIKEGDLLFLRQEKQWVQALMRHGMIYSMIFSIGLILILAAALYPLWRTYDDTSLSTVFTFTVFTSLFRINIQFIRQLFSIWFKRWRLYFINMASLITFFVVFQLFLISPYFVQWFLIIINGVAARFLFNVRLNLTWSFQADCLREGQRQLVLATSFIKASGYRVEKNFRANKEPFILFSESAQVFKNRTNSNIITETFIKFVIRNKSKLLTLFQLVVCFVVGIVVAPFWIKWIVLLLSTFSIIHFIRGSWDEMKNHLYFKLYPNPGHEETSYAVKKATFILTLPICFLFGFFTGWSAFFPFVWAGFLVAVIATTLMYFYVKKELMV
ncbi:hypothetical protein CR203_11745 [Salipaludibacillus neizhouensis]|uniref:ABC transporter permease n=1 Tax=Salipaludibacillus neizhouensis TaxID=885475 RepID=A0A3A9KR85_9BACI|nr:ABC transporter permease [Salipaludibacillus neizhouensis]RKL67176.1 hypothetical protein CR203_11745 [Salipaludibacillus neizhouensis]